MCGEAAASSTNGGLYRGWPSIGPMNEDTAHLYWSQSLSDSSHSLCVMMGVQGNAAAAVAAVDSRELCRTAEMLRLS